MAHKKPVTQKRLLQAIKKIHREYVKRSHSLDLVGCPLCEIYYVDEMHVYNCNDCPMIIFKDGNNLRYACMNRKCRPVNCWETEKKHMIPRVIEFYKNFVEAVEKMTDEQVQAPNAWKFLKTVDKRVYKKDQDGRL